SLPSKEYRELLGSAICVFNSNNSFVIENSLRNDVSGRYNWHELIDYTSGELSEPVKKTITQNSNTVIARKFNEIIEIRNRIMQSFQTTAPKRTGIDNDKDNQIIDTKYKDGKQAYITNEFLYDFSEKNDVLSSELHKFKEY